MAKYWIANVNDTRVEVEGEPVTFSELPGIDFFLWFGYDIDSWFVTEVSTGCNIAIKDTEESAIMLAQQRLYDIGLDDVKAAIACRKPVMDLPEG